MRRGLFGLDELCLPWSLSGAEEARSGGGGFGTGREAGDNYKSALARGTKCLVIVRGDQQRWRRFEMR